MRPSNVTLGEQDLPPIDGPVENYWRLNDLRQGVTPVYWRGFLGSPAPDLSDCLAERLPGRPWLLQLWEPLHTKAPSPAHSRPWCCYSRTVIFYHRPYILRPAHPWKCNGRWEWLPAGGGYVEYDQIETRLGWEDIVRFDGDEFIIQGGRVMWHDARWWMHRSARRKQPMLRAV